MIEDLQKAIDEENPSLSEQEMEELQGRKGLHQPIFHSLEIMAIIAFLLPDTSSFSSFIAENHLHLPRNRDAFTIDFAHPGLQFNDVSLVILFVPLTRIMTFDDSLA